MIVLVVGLLVLIAIMLTATSLLCVLSLGTAIYLWRKSSQAQGRIETLTSTVYTLYAEKAVLAERHSKPFSFGKHSSELH
jgi:hypothetical protein